MYLGPGIYWRRGFVEEKEDIDMGYRVIVANTDSTFREGWKVAGSISFNPADYTYTVSTLRAILSITEPRFHAQARLWCVDTSTQIGPVLSTNSVVPVELDAAVVMPAGNHVYELQYQTDEENYIATCYGAVLYLA